MVNIDNIRRIVKKLKEKYGTNDPFVLAKKLKIDIIYDDIGEISGLYKICVRRKYVVLSYDLEDDNSIYLVLLHEIGHCVMHKFLRPQFKIGSHILPKGSIYETEADLFALEFLGPDFYIENIEKSGIKEKRFRNLENIIREFY